MYCSLFSRCLLYQTVTQALPSTLNHRKPSAMIMSWNAGHDTTPYDNLVVPLY